jgi:hypothetical protein
MPSNDTAMFMESRTVLRVPTDAIHMYGTL